MKYILMMMSSIMPITVSKAVSAADELKPETQKKKNDSLNDKKKKLSDFCFCRLKKRK